MEGPGKGKGEARLAQGSSTCSSGVRECLFARERNAAVKLRHQHKEGEREGKEAGKRARSPEAKRPTGASKEEAAKHKQTPPRARARQEHGVQTEPAACFARMHARKGSPWLPHCTCAQHVRCCSAHHALCCTMPFTFKARRPQAQTLWRLCACVCDFSVCLTYTERCSLMHGFR